MKTLSDIAHYLRIYRSYIGRRVYIVFGLATLAALAEGLGIALLLPLLKAAQTDESTDEMGMVEQFLQDLLVWMGIDESIVGILVFIAVVFVGKGLLKFAEKGYIQYLKAQLLRELKLQLFDAYSSMEYRHYISQNTGHFINVINQQVTRFFNSFGGFASFLTKIITTVGYFAIAFAIAWRFTLMALGVGLVLLFFFRYLNEYVRGISRQLSREMSTLNTFLVQSLQAFKYILSTDQVDHIRTEVRGSIHRLTKYMYRQGLASAFTGAVKEPVSVLLIVSIVAIQVTVLEAPVAPLFVAILLFHRGTQSILSVQGQWQGVMNMIGSVEMVDDEFQTVLRRQEESGTHELDALEQGIEFHDVYYAYNEKDGDVLRDINLTIPANSTVALVGESGAGKSTLVDMLTLLLRPRTGEIRIDGVPGQEVDLSSWRSQIGYVSQETVVFDDTVANNIHLWQGDIEQDTGLQERVHNAARQAHADQFIRDLPDGYQTVVGDRGVRLSGGQKQRLFVARELFKQPNLLILDEATSDLDSASEQHIQSSIDALQGEVTVVIIAHRLSTVKSADRVYVLDEGQVIEEGGYHELRARENGQFREMVEMQSL